MQVLEWVNISNRACTFMKAETIIQVLNTFPSISGGAMCKNKEKNALKKNKLIFEKRNERSVGWDRVLRIKLNWAEEWKPWGLIKKMEDDGLWNCEH